MSLNPALERLIQTKLAHTHAQQWELPIAQVRQAFRDLWTPAITGESPAIFKSEDVTLDGADSKLRARIYWPEGADRLPLLVYFHGGGFVKGGLDESDTFCRRLARTTRHIVVAVDYRLAPEYPFPAALDDAFVATSWSLEHASELNASAHSVVVCGESAGGNLAAGVCLLARGNPKLTVRHQVLLQPAVDFTLSFPSIVMPAAQCLVPRDDLAWYYRTYCGKETAYNDVRVSPIFAADLGGLHLH